MTSVDTHASDTAVGDEWWRRAVVYQVYPRSFADSDGDGIGDLPGLIAHLDHLQALGVDVLWVSPFYPSPGVDNGYDVSDYRDVDPVLGTLDDVDELIAQLHARDMRLVIDVVLNHTSDQHPWFQASRSSADDPKRDWYWWRPPRPGHEPGTPGAEPTNWTSFFSGPAWTYDETTGEYYLHLFTAAQPDLNWENPEVREALYDMLRWWLDRGVDGFRMDVVNLVSKRTPLRDGEVVGDAMYGVGWEQYVCGPRIHEFLQELHREVLAPAGRTLLTVGEMPGVSTEEAARFTDPANAEIDMVFQFEHVDLDHVAPNKFDPRPLRLTELKASMARWQQDLSESGWNSLYLTNHDQPRPVSRFGSTDPRWRDRSAKLLATVLHMHRGTPYVYQGEELGMANYPWGTIEDFDDVESINHHRDAVAAGADPGAVLEALRVKSRDNARTPMQWDASPHAGFTTGVPWLAVNPDHQAVNAAAQRDDPDSVFHHYRRLIELRHDDDTVVHGRFEMLLPDDEQVYAFVRRHADDELLVVANFGDDEVEPALPTGWDGAELVLGNVDDRRGATDPLRPWEARIHRRTSGRSRP